MKMPDDFHSAAAQAREASDLAADVLDGLRRRPRSIACKWLYDEAGSRLFEDITRLPEYYPTRTEVGILRARAGEIAGVIGRGSALVEYGSGSSLKTHLLLDAVADSIAGYVPVDISRWALDDAARRLADRYPSLAVAPVCADYTADFALPDLGRRGDGRTVAFFPGGTIGNFSPADAVAFLRRVRDTVGEGGGLIVGVDLKKDPNVLHAAYNDAAGVTAAFDLNLLDRINRDLGGTFDRDAWSHYAYYDPAGDGPGRIRMNLVALSDQSVTVAGERFDFARGEAIHTEDSHKYGLPGFAALADRAGSRSPTCGPTTTPVQRPAPAGDGVTAPLSPDLKRPLAPALPLGPPCHRTEKRPRITRRITPSRSSARS